jgi:serine/threonine protein kinase
VAVKVIDLGRAKSINKPGSQTAISTPGGFVGTPEFASPEQFGGVGVDIRSDLYALGATLWQTVTGYAAFRGSAAEVMYQRQHAPLPIDQLEGIPQPLVILLEVLLEKDSRPPLSETGRTSEGDTGGRRCYRRTAQNHSPEPTKDAL